MLIRFEPIDTLFFRDGRPYHQGENTQTNVPSRFPPSPTTLVGAIRAAWARALGWSGYGPWGDALRARLGGDADVLSGGLRFRGPLLLHAPANAPPSGLFPLPSSVIGRDGDETLPTPPVPTDLALLRPGSEQHTPALDCDLGPAVALPAVQRSAVDEDTAGLTTQEGWWIDAPGLSQVLAGSPPAPAHLHWWRSLWATEPRVAIERDRARRTTGQGAMYSPIQVRLGRAQALGMLADGLPAEPAVLRDVAARPQPLGGESRSAWLTCLSADEATLLPQAPRLTTTGAELRYSIYVATPMALAGPPLPGTGLAGLPGALVSACAARPELWGGWRTVADGGVGPQPLRPYLPPGSVLFMRADAGAADAVARLHGRCVGERASWGFGLVFIGTW
jgi:CRISPR-associated protein Cmr3